jgi:hypothetical protein
MDVDLLVGVKTSSAVNESSVLLVIVDKRLADVLEAPPARNVKFRLNAVAAPDSASVRILPAGTSTGVTYFDSQTRLLTVRGLSGGDAVAIVLQSSAALMAAQALRRWRISPSRLSMDDVRTMQYSTYNYVYANRRTTAFILGSLDSGSMRGGESVAARAHSGYNLLVANVKDSAAVMNAGLREGVLALTRLGDTSEADIRRVHKAFGCHPNWAGYLLHTGIDVKPSNALLLRELRQARDEILQLSPGAFAIATASSAADVLRVSNKTGLPMVALSLPRSSSGWFQELVDLRDALPGALALPGAPAVSTAFLVAVDPCAGTPGLARLQTYAALMLGAAGILHRSTSCEDGDRIDAVAAVNDNVAQWAIRLDPSTRRLVSLAQGTGGSPWPVPNRVNGTISAPIASIGSLELVVGTFIPVDASGEVNRTVVPPFLLLLDARADGGREEVNLTLSTAVVGWTPFVGDCEAGFANCAKLVRGNKPRPSLLPGEALLIGLTMLAV